MAKIELLDELTINKIAAGEVIERPLSVVKELVENSVDSGATSITVEIRSGGIDFIRVTDNGSGIPASEVRQAFLPHATSKIRSADDLFDIRSLGFRGEALSTIAAVAQTEMVTKTKQALTGVLYKINGGKEVSLEEVGSADGTTVITRNLFLHVPARRKFLKSSMTEAGYITEFIQKIAIERSDIAFKYVVNNDTKLVTTGNGSVKDNIYRVYGRDIMDALIPVKASDNGMSISGYAAKPVVARNNRSQEVFFVNGHAVSDRVLEKAVEAAYKPFLMQHKFPFVFLFLSLDPGMVDVNVHPRKSEVRFSLGRAVYDFVEESTEKALRSIELINRVELAPDKKEESPVKDHAPEPFEMREAAEIDHLYKKGASVKAENKNQGFFVETGEPDPVEKEVGEAPSFISENDALRERDTVSRFSPAEYGAVLRRSESDNNEPLQEGKGQDKADRSYGSPSEEGGREEFFREEYAGDGQTVLFDERMIQPSNKPDFNIIGCVFDTYWIIEYRDRMLLIDQHAAHEKVMYEQFVKDYKEKRVVSQYLNPPIIVTLSGRQEETVERYREAFSSLGYELERFEGSDYALRAVPSGFMKLNDRELFIGLLDELTGTAGETSDVSLIHDRLAEMSCKAAVKGGRRLSLMEAEELLGRLLSLENPYNCPHGRPTMVEFTERDLEKFFKRIV